MIICIIWSIIDKSEPGYEEDGLKSLSEAECWSLINTELFSSG